MVVRLFIYSVIGSNQEYQIYSFGSWQTEQCILNRSTRPGSVIFFSIYFSRTNDVQGTVELARNGTGCVLSNLESIYETSFSVSSAEGLALIIKEKWCQKIFDENKAGWICFVNA